MIIAVDASGGDYAPYEIVKGAVKACEEYEIDIALVGKQNILQVATRRHTKKERLTIINASQVISCDESPMKGVQGKPDSSIVIGVNLVKTGAASAFVSAGNTGAVLVASLLSLGRQKDIERPAIATILDITSSTPVLLVDSGANVDCRPIHLLQFAYLGSIYAQQILNIPSPRIGLLNNGQEEAKGNRLTIETYKLLKESELNFIGNVEGQDLLKRVADVIVTDGFTGNIVLKTLEGLGDTFQSRLSQLGRTVTTAYHLPGRLLHNVVGLDSWARRMDFQEYGGACLLGLNGTVIITHGRSKAKAIKNAIGLAKQTVERNVLQKINQEGVKT